MTVFKIVLTITCVLGIGITISAIVIISLGKLKIDAEKISVGKKVLAIGEIPLIISFFMIVGILLSKLLEFFK
jgi:hypothetical protein